MPARSHRAGCIAPGLLGLALALCAGCSGPSPEIVKIGLVAPFEGRYREIGVDVIPAARLAIRDWAARGHSGAPLIELVAYDDAGDMRLAADQARRLTADPAVAIVIGHWRSATTREALSVYHDAGLPLITYSPDDLGEPTDARVLNLAPSQQALLAAAREWSAASGAGLDTASFAGEEIEQAAAGFQATHNAAGSEVIGGPLWGLSQFPLLVGRQAMAGPLFVTGLALPGDQIGSYWSHEAAESFASRYEEGSLGAPPGLYASAAYEATWVAIEEILRSRGIEPGPTPASDLRFGRDGRQMDPPIYLYRWEQGRRRLLMVKPQDGSQATQTLCSRALSMSCCFRSHNFWVSETW